MSGSVSRSVAVDTLPVDEALSSVGGWLLVVQTIAVQIRQSLCVDIVEDWGQGQSCGSPIVSCWGMEIQSPSPIVNCWGMEIQSPSPIVSCWDMEIQSPSPIVSCWGMQIQSPSPIWMCGMVWCVDTVEWSGVLTLLLGNGLVC